MHRATSIGRLKMVCLYPFVISSLSALGLLTVVLLGHHSLLTCFKYGINSTTVLHGARDGRGVHLSSFQLFIDDITFSQAVDFALQIVKRQKQSQTAG